MVAIKKESPGTGDVHVDEVVQDWAVSYMQDDTKYVCHRTFASISVDKPSNKYPKYPKGHFFRSDAKKRADGAESAGKRFKVDNTSSYYCDVWAVHKDLSWRTRKAADNPMSADMGATKVVAMDLQIRREIEFATEFLASSAGWTTKKNGGTDFTRWDQSNSTPFDDIASWMDDQEEETGMRPNVIVFGPRVWTLLRSHTDFLSRITGQGSSAAPAMVTKQAFAGLFEVEEVLVASATYNAAAEVAPSATETPDMTFIVGDVCLLAYRNNAPTLDEPAAGYMIEYSEYDEVKPGQPAVGTMEIETKKVTRFEGEMAFDPIISAPDAAVLAYDIIT